jgi:Transglycosylase-like domain
LPHRSGRRVAATVALVALFVFTSFQAPVSANAHAPEIDRFLYALSQVESGGRYDARNKHSGAYGRYQIMPMNWKPWAKKYIGTSRAKQTPRMQEFVARGKVHDLYHWLGSYRRVAYWWLTGKSKTSGWSKPAKRYVNNVMAILKRTTIEKVASTRGVRHYTEKSEFIDYSGSWSRARHRSYRGDAVRQATRMGTSATFRFVGSQVAWYGPKGPTRGKARVSIDGLYVKTIDLYARRFDPRNRIYTKAFAQSGAHALTITVVGTKGRPVVAIDEFLVWD